MSLMIEGMKLPHHSAVNGEKDTAYRCIVLVHPDNTVELVIDTEFASAYDNGHNIQRYPITEIPTPHDRLIDERFFKTAHPLMVDLKSCPFCGSKAEFVVINRENRDTTKPHIIRCVDTFRCGAQIEDYISNWSRDYKEQVKKLFNRWNRRISNEK